MGSNQSVTHSFSSVLPTKGEEGAVSILRLLCSGAVALCQYLFNAVLYTTSKQILDLGKDIWANKLSEGFPLP